MTGGKLRSSKQRDRILELLHATDEHPTAAWIYDRLKAEFPRLSLGNVYRNLHILVEQGLIEKIEGGSTFDRYEAVGTPHCHLVCEGCGAIVDLELPMSAVEELTERLNSSGPHRATRARLEFYGFCENCVPDHEPDREYESVQD